MILTFLIVIITWLSLVSLLPSILSIFRLGYKKYIKLYVMLKFIHNNIDNCYLSSDNEYCLPIYYSYNKLYMIYFKKEIYQLNWLDLSIIESYDKNGGWGFEKINYDTNCLFLRILRDKIINKIKKIPIIEIDGLSDISKLVNDNIKIIKRDIKLNQILVNG